MQRSAVKIHYRFIFITLEHTLEKNQTSVHLKAVINDSTILLHLLDTDAHIKQWLLSHVQSTDAEKCSRLARSCVCMLKGIPGPIWRILPFPLHPLSIEKSCLRVTLIHLWRSTTATSFRRRFDQSLKINCHRRKTNRSSSMLIIGTWQYRLQTCGAIRD